VAKPPVNFNKRMDIKEVKAAVQAEEYYDEEYDDLEDSMEAIPSKQKSPDMIKKSPVKQPLTLINYPKSSPGKKKKPPLMITSK
jgi:hypothetical protein